MKALSLMQPWASLVVMGQKKIETRIWSTSYRGSLLVHASKSKRGLVLGGMDPFSLLIPDFSVLPFGAIIGKVNLEEIIRIDDLIYTEHWVNRLSLEERAFGKYTGKFAWVFTEPELFKKPIPVHGSLMLWDYKGEIG